MTYTDLPLTIEALHQLVQEQRELRSVPCMIESTNDSLQLTVRQRLEEYVKNDFNLSANKRFLGGSDHSEPDMEKLVEEAFDFLGMWNQNLYIF